MDERSVTLTPLLKLNGLVACTLQKRENRFVARVIVRSTERLALIRNTGRLPEVKQGTRLLCLPKGRGRMSLVVVGHEVENGEKKRREGGAVATILDPVLQSKAFEASAKRGLLPWLRGWAVGRREIKMGDSRLDYEIREGSSIGYLETKSAALLLGQFASYPDCPTDRGVKHINLLGEIAGTGIKAVILFIATHPDSKAFAPNDRGDKRVGKALVVAREKGVEVRAMKIGLKVSLSESLSLVTLEKAELGVILE